MSITLGEIEFGETDAKHEVFSQARDRSYILMNAFQMPPSVRFERLLSGAKFFISGLKGTGKTSLLLYLKEQIDRSGGRSHIVLFKSKLTEPERQRLSPIGDLTAFTDQDKIRFEYDYKVNWLWFAIGEIVRLIEPGDVIAGRDELHDLKRLTGVDSHKSRSMFSGLQLTKIKAIVDAVLSVGPLKTSVRTELEGMAGTKEEKFMHIVDMCERMLCDIRLLPGKRICIFFDELELFVGKLDQKERDLHLIRDLLYVVARLNQGFGSERSEICLYASVRSEVMYEINRLSPEISRDVGDFGVSVDWHGTSDTPDQTILQIICLKINISELAIGVEQTDNVISRYFQSRLSGKTAYQYLLDISMFKPRTLIILMRTIAGRFPTATLVTDENIKAVEATFSNDMWREVEEELQTSYDGLAVAAIKGALRGLPVRTTLAKLEAHIQRRGQSDDQVRRVLGTKSSIRDLIGTLYRVGAVGTQSVSQSNAKSIARDAWVFRHVYEPQFADNIIFHGSLRKALQLI